MEGLQENHTNTGTHTTTVSAQQSIQSHGRVFSVLNQGVTHDNLGKIPNHHLMKEYTFEKSGRTYKTKYILNDQSHFSSDQVTHDHRLVGDDSDLAYLGFKSYRVERLNFRVESNKGYINFGISKIPHKDEKKNTSCLSIHDIFIHEDARGNGIGKELWDIVEHIAKEHDCDFIIGKLHAEYGKDQTSLESAKRKQGYEISDEGVSVKFLSIGAREKYEFLKRESARGEAYIKQLKSEGYDFLRDYLWLPVGQS